MKSVHVIQGRGVPLKRSDVDTDQIIPAQYLTLVPTIPAEYEKLGAYAMIGLPDALYPARFVADGQLDSAFPIIVAGKNFGCGSSREHAPWALLDFGIRCIIAPGFASIFYENCLKNGILPVVLPLIDVENLASRQRGALTVDLVTQSISDADGRIAAFELEPSRRAALLEGRDEIDDTLSHAEAIAVFQARDREQRPWVWGGNNRKNEFR